MSDTRTALAQHLRSLGFECGVDKPRVHEAMRRYMGDKRFREFLECIRAPEGDRQSLLTGMVRDIVEANLVRSLDLDVTLETSCHLYSVALPLLLPGRTVLELGCWTGALTSFIAARHPETRVIGVDYASNLIRMAQDRFSLSNLSFVQWDYRGPKPGELPQADLLLSSIGIVNPPRQYGATIDPSRPRDSDAYHWWCQQWQVYFRRWREAAVDGAKLIIIHRLSTLPQLLAFVDVAHRSGWAVDLSQFGRAVVPASKLMLPCVVFTAAEAAPVPFAPEDELLARWMWLFQKDDPYVQIDGPVAVSLYRSFAQRRVLAARVHEQEDGTLVQQEIGTLGAMSYIFKWDGQRGVRLLLVSEPRARQLADIWQREQRSAEADVDRAQLTAPPHAQRNPFLSGDAPTED